METPVGIGKRWRVTQIENRQVWMGSGYERQTPPPSPCYLSSGSRQPSWHCHDGNLVSSCWGSWVQ